MRKTVLTVALGSLLLAVACSAFNVGYATLVATPPSEIPPMQVGLAYSLQLAATGGLTPYAWSCCATGSLPPGITISTAGLISGTPTTPGSYTPVFQVTDSESTPQKATIQVDPEVFPAKARIARFVVPGSLTITAIFSGSNIQNSGAIYAGGTFGMAGANLVMPDSVTFMPVAGCASCSGPTAATGVTLAQSSGTPSELIIAGTAPVGLLPGSYTLNIVYDGGAASYTTFPIDPERPLIVFPGEPLTTPRGAAIVCAISEGPC